MDTPESNSEEGNVSQYTEEEMREADERFFKRIRERIDNNRFEHTMQELRDRLDTADDVNMLPPPSKPTAIAREEFLLEQNFLRTILRGRMEAMKGAALFDKKSEKLPPINGFPYGRLKAGNTTLTGVKIDGNLSPDKVPNMLQFSATGEFPQGKVQVTYSTKDEAKVMVEFPVGKGEEKRIYNSKQVPTENLTFEETFLALHVIENAYLNLFDPQRKETQDNSET